MKAFSILLGFIVAGFVVSYVVGFLFGYAGGLPYQFEQESKK